MIQSKRAFVVDDYENWRILLCNVLEEYGFSVKFASEFQEANDIIKQQKFDLAVIDIRLNDNDSLDLDGITLIETIKSINPITKIIAITGYPNDIRELPEEADEFFVKAENASLHNFKSILNKIK